MSTAICSAAGAVRLPLRVCNDVELALLNGELNVLHIFVMGLQLASD